MLLYVELNLPPARPLNINDYNPSFFERLMDGDLVTSLEFMAATILILLLITAAYQIIIRLLKKKEDNEKRTEKIRFQKSWAYYILAGIILCFILIFSHSDFEYYIILVAGFLVTTVAKMCDPIMLLVSLIAGLLCYESSKKSILAGAITGATLTALAHMMSFSLQRRFPLISYPAGTLAGILLVWGTGAIRRILMKKSGKHNA